MSEKINLKLEEVKQLAKEVEEIGRTQFLVKHKAIKVLSNGDWSILQFEGLKLEMVEAMPGYLYETDIPYIFWREVLRQVEFYIYKRNEKAKHKLKLQKKMSNLPTDNLKYCNDALDLRESIENDFLVLAEHLYNIKEHNLFEPQWSSFVEFCFELRMTSSSINRLIQVHKILVLDYGLPREEITHAGVSNLFDVLGSINNKKDAQKWLAKATLLTRQDLRKELTEHKTGILMSKCKHEDTYTVEICRKCGERRQIP